MRCRAAWPLIAAIAVACAPGEGSAHTIYAEPGGAPHTLGDAAAGDTVFLAPGKHPGPLRVTRAIVLRGAPGAIVDGGGTGSVIVVTASGATIENVEVRGSGDDVMNIDSGVRVASAANVTLRGLEIHDVLYGIYGERAVGLSIDRCRLRGRVSPRTGTGEGNGMHLWYGDDVRVTGTTAERFVDAIYLSFTNHVRIEGDTLRDCGRYGLHTMYCQENHLLRSLFTRNLAGCAIMFSNHLDVVGNEFVHNRGPRTYGVLLRDCSDGTFEDNRMVDNTVAVFMDNSNRNRFHGNLIENNGWGVILFSSCAGNTFAGNNVIQCDYPVALDMKYTDNRFDDGVDGNYWSDNAAYDLDGNGVSDVPYSPVTAFAFVSKQYPDLTVLAKSPAVAALGVAERVFPALRPSEAVDRFPRVAPVSIPAARGSLGATRMHPAWGLGAGFLALFVLGAIGITRSRFAS